MQTRNRTATTLSPCMRYWVCWIFLTIVIHRATSQLNNKTSPTHRFKSRPDLHAPILDIQVLRPKLVTPGYIFLAPYRNVDPGPYIYDNFGNLVWSGAGQSGSKTAHTPRVCRYLEKDHLCYFQGEQHQGFARGHGVIMDQSYRVVKTIESSGAGASSDMHEFKITPYSGDKTVLLTVYQPRRYDLTTNARFNLQHGLGWIVDGVFQEIDIETGQILFEWRSLDHVDPSHAWTLPGSTDTSGDGLHEQTPWDYFHLNSIDKNVEGDYLISARHVSAIYKISGLDGHIIWQLGGNSPDFEQTNFQFSYQHHARWISENETHTVFSFFDNGSNNYNHTGHFSHGWIVSIDHIRGTATVIKQWGAPMEDGGLRSSSQGNMQLLPNGAVHIGWGEYAYFSEHTSGGTCVQFAKVAQRASDVMIYRSNKYNWTAQPVTKPALWTYSKFGTGGEGLRNTSAGKTSFWVSWNGATEVHSWDFYTANSARGPWQFAGNEVKNGFETVFHSSKFAAWSYAEALDRQGRPLEASVIAKTFVPSETLRFYCHDEGCDYNEKGPLEAQVPYESENHVQEHMLSISRGYDTGHYYAEIAEAADGLGLPVHGLDRTTSGALFANHSSVAVSVGIVIGFTMATVMLVLCRPCGSRKLHCTRSCIGDSERHALFRSRMLGRYTRITESDVLDPGSSSSSNDGL